MSADTPQSEKEKMLAGELYRSADPELVRDRLAVRRLVRRFNTTTEEELELRQELFRRIVGHAAGGVEVEPPFNCDYGYNISVGATFYANFGCVMLDCARITIGDNAFLGPYVQLYTAYHPLEPAVRNAGVELAAPITIGHNVWIGGGTVINPGVTIGDNVTIGSGSVVTRDIPPNVVAAGNPCRVLRRLEELK